MKTSMQRVLTTLFISLCLAAIGQKAQALVPAPDGCYPGYTTAEGCNALNFLTTGLGNTGVGWYSLFANSTGSFNTSVGGGALALNNADSNTAVGAAALLLNTTGAENTATGTDALAFNTASGNTATGYYALINNSTGDSNTATGRGALMLNAAGANNTANGFDALESNSTGTSNTAVGSGALGLNTTGNNNIAVGVFTGLNITSANNVICIGNNLAGANADNTCFIANIFSATASGGSAVFINSNGQLGTLTSSKRFKEEIKPMEEASEALFSLKPVSFHYKKEIDPAGTSQFGLVAEDVEKVNPDLVVRDKKGRPYTVRYDQVNAMLLNEFLKEHTAFLEEQHKVQRLEAALEALNQRLKEQEAKIERVSAQVEMSRPGPQVVQVP
jgi:hypothetical protein